MQFICPLISITINNFICLEVKLFNLRCLNRLNNNRNTIPTVCIFIAYYSLIVLKRIIDTVIAHVAIRYRIIQRLLHVEANVIACMIAIME